MLLRYLYAVVEGLPSGWRAPPPVVGERVERGNRTGLVLLSSAASVVPPASPTTLALHHDVVASALDADGLVPFRYGTALLSSDLDDWLVRERPALDGALASVRGCVEMSVKLLRLEATPSGGPSVDAMRDAADERRLRELADQIVERAALAQWRYRPAGTAGNVVASVAFLLPRAELPDFLARIAPVASHAVGVAVVPTGPWPAYSFVPAFDRAPLASSTPPPIDRADRRAG
jgi:Gas vesicle synthesis protein GvpL/GvpF